MSYMINSFGAVSSGGTWTPASLGSTVKGWWDADQQTEADGADVSSFVDRSGNGYHWGTEGAEAKPVLRYNYVNGKKALDGSAAGRKCLIIVDTADFMESATSATMMMVVKGHSDPAGGGGVDLGPLQNLSSSGTTNHFYTDGQIYENFASNTRRNTNPPTSWNAWRIYGAHSATNDWKMWYDGTAIITDTSNIFGTGTANRRLFIQQGVGSATFGGQIAEIVICDSKLSDGDRQKLEGYYAHKYGLTANLPGGHPYISSPP